MKWLVVAVVVVACSKHEDAAPAAVGSAEKPHHHEDRGDPADKSPALALAVVVDGAPATWTKDAFDKTPHFVNTNNGGESRDVWSLRELAHAMVGPTARVVAVTGDVTKAIDAAAWADATRTPIVHTTRRGTLKFRWADKDGKWLDTEVKDVTKLELAAK
jgi:hypothetical protein